MGEAKKNIIDTINRLNDYGTIVDHWVGNGEFGVVVELPNKERWNITYSEPDEEEE